MKRGASLALGWMIMVGCPAEDTATEPEQDSGSVSGSVSGSGSASDSASAPDSDSDSGSDSDSDSDSGSDSTGVDDGFGPGPWDDGVEIPPEPQVPGDPDVGYRALIEKGYVTCGIPFPLFELGRDLLGAFTGEEPLPGRTGKNAEVPLNWTVHETSDGAEIVSLNCLECHAGRFNGELVEGLGKADVDYTDSIYTKLDGIPTPDLPIPGIEQMLRMIERGAAVGPLTQAPNIGVNPADTLAIVLASHRDRDTLAWFDEPQLPLPEAMVPVDTPPWWRVAKKGALFYNGMARGDHRGTMMFASSLCTDDVDEMQEILSYFHDIRAYIASIRAPKYPFSIDQELAAAGEPLFEAKCAGCHGLYSDDDDSEWFPNLLLPLSVVGTDPSMALAGIEYDVFIEWFNDSPYGEITRLEPEAPFPGYIAPPLDGIWATAPYLHNASVPTLELLLDSSARPKYWRRVDYDTANFDEATLGWPYLELDLDWTGGADGLPESERIHVYDTTRVGYSNAGHTFGDALTQDERRALLEYLKTL